MIKFEFVKNCYANTGFKFDILPEEWEMIKQKFYDKIKEKSKNSIYGDATIYVEINNKKPYYTLYGDKLLIENALYEIAQGQ